MIIVRPTEPFRVVCLSDPALDEVPAQKMIEYGARRDISILDLDKLTQQPTVFECDPLKPEYEHLAAGDMGPFEAWGIFSTHVRSIKPAPVEIKYITRQGDKVIDPDAQKLISPRVYNEVANVIIQRADSDGADVPFSVQDTSWQTARTQRAALRAMSARTTTTANETSSD